MASVDVFQRSRYTTSVDRMLRDPKGGDPEGVSRLDVLQTRTFQSIISIIICTHILYIYMYLFLCQINPFLIYFELFWQPVN